MGVLGSARSEHGFLMRVGSPWGSCCLRPLERHAHRIRAVLTFLLLPFLLTLVLLTLGIQIGGHLERWQTSAVGHAEKNISCLPVMSN